VGDCGYFFHQWPALNLTAKGASLRKSLVEDARKLSSVLIAYRRPLCITQAGQHLIGHDNANILAGLAILIRISVCDLDLLAFALASLIPA
jgi:hypothetical protein